MKDIEKIRKQIELERKSMQFLVELTTPEQMSKTCAIFQYADAMLAKLDSFIVAEQECIEYIKKDKVLEILKNAKDLADAYCKIDSF